MRIPVRTILAHPSPSTIPRARFFSTSRPLHEIRSIEELPDAAQRTYTQNSTAKASKHRTLHYATPPRNVLMLQKQGSEYVKQTATKFITYLHDNHPDVNVILEPDIAADLHRSLARPVYALPPDTVPKTSPPSDQPRTSFPSFFIHHSASLSSPTSAADASTGSTAYHRKTDLITTLGGDGTILHASSLFSTSARVPPFLTFSLGTLGFLSEFPPSSHAAAFTSILTPAAPPTVLFRQRLKASICERAGKCGVGAYGMNEVSLHRGEDPHLIRLEIYINGQLLTEAVADGITISTPTGSTAYSLSSGGPLVHPAVPALLITPICPRSLSFRPVVVPAETEVLLRLAGGNRGEGVQVSVDGKRWGAMRRGEEVRVWGEEGVGREGGREGGIPVVRKAGCGDGWIAGLNGLLKFNHPFGGEERDA